MRLVVARVAGDDSAGRVVPLPRLDVLAMIPPGGFLSPGFADRTGSGRIGRRPNSRRTEGRLHSFITAFQGDYAAWAGRWMPRSLTLIVLTVAATGAAWVLLGFWGVRWLLRHSREPSAADSGGL